MKKIIYAVLICSLLFSCDKASKTNSDYDTNLKELSPLKSVTEDKTSSKDINTVADSSGVTSNIPLQGTMPGQNTDWDKKIIKTANLQVEVKNFYQYNLSVHNAAKQYGGYIANEEQNFSKEKKESGISIKVPVDQFDNLINQLPSDSNKVIEKKITTEDVTGEVVDTKSRLETKEQMRLKYLEFLKQAKNMSDVLKVQTEINSIQEDMESASSRINFFSHQSAYSTINLTFYQPLTGFTPVNNNPVFYTKILIAFKSGFNFMAEIFIGLVSVWPVFLFAFIVWAFFKRKVWKPVPAKQKQNFV